MNIVRMDLAASQRREWLSGCLTISLKLILFTFAALLTIRCGAQAASSNTTVGNGVSLNSTTYLNSGAPNLLLGGSGVDLLLLVPSSSQIGTILGVLSSQTSTSFPNIALRQPRKVIEHHGGINIGTTLDRWRSRSSSIKEQTSIHSDRDNIGTTLWMRYHNSSIKRPASFYSRVGKTLSSAIHASVNQTSTDALTYPLFEQQLLNRTEGGLASDMTPANQSLTSRYNSKQIRIGVHQPLEVKYNHDNRIPVVAVSRSFCFKNRRTDEVLESHVSQITSTSNVDDSPSVLTPILSQSLPHHTNFVDYFPSTKPKSKTQISRREASLPDVSSQRLRTRSASIGGSSSNHTSSSSAQYHHYQNKQHHYGSPPSQHYLQGPSTTPPSHIIPVGIPHHRLHLYPPLGTLGTYGGSWFPDTHKNNFRTRNRSSSGLPEVEIVSLDVPPRPQEGETVTLTCHYRLHGQKLYSLSWWRGPDQFFLYNWNGQKSAYAFDGIRVDETRSTERSVVLVSVSAPSGGEYKCEVMGEAPAFRTAVMYRNMTVIVMPSSVTIPRPQMGDGSLPPFHYRPRDPVALNCTATDARPRAALRWLLDDGPVSPDGVTTFLDTTNHRGLITSSIGLRLSTLHHLHRDQVAVKCVASLSGQQVASAIRTLHVVRDATAQPNTRASEAGKALLGVSAPLFLIPLLLLVLPRPL